MLGTVGMDRVSGVLVGQACGDALGVPYEFASLPAAGQPAEMLGGGLGNYEPGEYSDDTQMAVCIARVAATGADLTGDDALDEIADGFLSWEAGGPSDVGIQTRSVLSRARSGRGRPAARLRDAAAGWHARTGKSAGNGALMRTAPVTLANLNDPQAMAASARAVAELTHPDPLAGDACVLWCAGIARAITEGSFDGVRAGLELLVPAHRDRWASWLAEAEQSPPERFNPNGFTVPALQAAYSAVCSTVVPQDDPANGMFPCLHLQHGMQAAVRAGNDTDTVAAIAGALLGARWGVSAVPLAWQRVVHGWPSLRVRDLVRLAVLAARHGQPDAQGWPSAPRLSYAVPAWPGVPHPADDGVLLGGFGALGTDVDAVVSLCRLGAAEVPAVGVDAGNHIEVPLIDTEDPGYNPNLEFVIDDAARTVAALREEGKRVLLHCAQAQRRTPTVAARYAVLRGTPLEQALSEVTRALPDANPNRALRNALRHLGASEARPG
ncbi:MAG: ADP-ribosylglycohydrolase family protein [Pseudonocardiaceae bacterium]